jgi:hypothetical protein
MHAFNDKGYHPKAISGNQTEECSVNIYYIVADVCLFNRQR